MSRTDLKTGVVGELGTKAPARVATMTNITLSGLQTVNGVALLADDIVLVNGQTDTTENGVYIASTSDWARAVWFDDGLDAKAGTLIFTVEGSQKNNTLWQTVCADDPIVFGTSQITFNFFATASTGFTLINSNNLSDVSSIPTSVSNLGLTIGANTQAYNIKLDNYSALTTSNNTVPYFTGANGAIALKTIGTSSGNIPLVGTSSATETLAGLSKVATEAEVRAGNNDVNFITPLKLKNLNSVLQVQRGGTSASATGATPIPADDTIPQITEGNLYMTLSITPKSSTSILRVDVVAQASLNNITAVIVALFKDSNPDAVAVVSDVSSGNDRPMNFKLTYFTPSGSGSTAFTAFTVRIGAPSGTITFNGQASSRLFGGKYASSITITEYAS